MSDVKRYVSTRLLPDASTWNVSGAAHTYVHISDYAALEAECERLRVQVSALQSDANSWQSGYDKGREDGAKAAEGWKAQHARDSAELRKLCAERDALRAELAALKAPAVAGDEREAFQEAWSAGEFPDAFMEDHALCLSAFKAGAAWQRTQAAGVPGARLRADGEPDPHGDCYNCERAAPFAPAADPAPVAPAQPAAQTQPEVQRLREALEFYARGDHLMLADPDAWDTCSGEAENWLHDDEGTASVEDGSLAKAALAASTGQEVEK